ncbi:cell division protein ZipA [Linepithema humile]|uniref:cell division protein ZipA n=1 Tax=Linepithema humile TaxID=83485 RepID=UPI000623784E|nr:PREDICTED: extensin-like isoform X1 [Linepithema humile]
MRFLFLILAVAPVLGTELHSHVRERRQQSNYRSYNQAPASIRQILAAQQARDPIVHLPPQQIPNLSPARPIEPQYVNQAQLTSYRPQVQIAQAPQQPTYNQIPIKPAQYNPPPAAQQQYNPSARAQYNPSAAAQQYNPVAAAQQYNPVAAAPQYNPAAAARQYNPVAAAPQQYNPQYRTNFAPAPQAQQPQQVAQPNYQYSRNLPPQLQQLLQIQHNLPNAIPQGRQG